MIEVIDPAKLPRVEWSRPLRYSEDVAAAVVAEYADWDAPEDLIESWLHFGTSDREFVLMRGNENGETRFSVVEVKGELPRCELEDVDDEQSLVDGLIAFNVQRAAEATS